MTAAIERLAPEIRRLVSYHMGWTDARGNPVDSPGGKGIRPTLAMLAAEAAWAGPEVGVPGGVAVELVHNFSLIHDDIIDTDAERHHRPTVWAVFGIGPAIVAGDAMQILAHQVLLESSSGRGPAAAAALADATAAMIAGQADDIAFESRRDVSVEQCMAMCAAKTGALLGCAASIGAILAGAPDATVGALRDYGRHLGLAFQAVDDLLGIWGDPARTGKPAGSDLRQRKKTMPVVAALAAGGPESDELRELIVGPGGDTPARAARAVNRSDPRPVGGAAANGSVPIPGPTSNGVEARRSPDNGDAANGSDASPVVATAANGSGPVPGPTPNGIEASRGPAMGAGPSPAGASRPKPYEVLAPVAAGRLVGDSRAAASRRASATEDARRTDAGGLARATPDPRPPLTAEQIERATYLVEACGGREWTAVRAKSNLDAALGALERVRLSAIPHRDLADIAVFVVERES
jgi:geranylgeranyl diphosphate synthase type I